MYDSVAKLDFRMFFHGVFDGVHHLSRGGVSYAVNRYRHLMHMGTFHHVEQFFFVFVYLKASLSCFVGIIIEKPGRSSSERTVGHYFDAAQPVIIVAVAFAETSFVEFFQFGQIRHITLFADSYRHLVFF